MRYLELRIPPVLLVIIFAAVMSVLAWAAPDALSFSANPVMAVVFVVAGALVTLAGVFAFQHHGTTVNPFTPEQSSSVVDTGIYRFSRNPMYLGFFLALIGWCLYLANWVCVLMLPVFIAYMNQFQIKPEERALIDKFGQKFLTYSRSARRWL